MNIIIFVLFFIGHLCLQADGIMGLQKGLTPALFYQIVMNGMRFGLYRRVLESGVISQTDGSVSTLGCVAAGASVGVVGGFLGSPMYMVSEHAIVGVSVMLLSWYMRWHPR